MLPYFFKCYTKLFSKARLHRKVKAIKFFLILSCQQQCVNFNKFLEFDVGAFSNLENLI